MYDNQSWFTYCACCLRSSHPEMFYYIKGLLITNLSNSQECGELSFIWIKITKFLKILYFKPRITVSTLPCLSPPISLYYVILNTLLLKEFLSFQFVSVRPYFTLFDDQSTHEYETGDTRVLFRTLSNIYHGPFCWKPLTIFAKKLHYRCLAEF